MNALLLDICDSAGEQSVSSSTNGTVSSGEDNQADGLKRRKRSSLPWGM